jgi:hypothetical protein
VAICERVSNVAKETSQGRIGSGSVLGFRLPFTDPFVGVAMRHVVPIGEQAMADSV